MLSMRSDVGEQDESGEQIEEIPLCLRCASPVDPLNHYCPNCGEATGQLTPCIPFVNLRMQVTFWVQAWYQIWSRRTPFVWRCLLLVMIFLLFPMMTFALPFLLWDKFKPKKLPSAAG
jgi:hypothetical protein